MVFLLLFLTFFFFFFGGLCFWFLVLFSSFLFFSLLFSFFFSFFRDLCFPPIFFLMAISQCERQITYLKIIQSFEQKKRVTKSNNLIKDDIFNNDRRVTLPPAKLKTFRFFRGLIWNH